MIQITKSTFMDKECYIIKNTDNPNRVTISIDMPYEIAIQGENFEFWKKSYERHNGTK
jgi:hypothetical protein